MADEKVEDLANSVTTPDGDEYLYIVDTPSGTPAAKKITAANVLSGGWIGVPDSWAYASSTTITVPTDATTRYQKAMKVRFKQGAGYKYFYVTAVSATVLTVYGGSAYTVANSAITDIAYSPAACPFGFPMELAWTPSFTNLTVGNGTLTGYFSILGGGLLAFHWELVWGNTTSISGGVSFAPPVTIGTYGDIGQPPGWARLKAAGAAPAYNGFLAIASTTSILVRAQALSGSYLVGVNLSSTVPATWTTNDGIAVNGFYII